MSEIENNVGNVNKCHKNPDGSNVIENSQLYYDDVKKYNPLRVKKWIEEDTAV